MKVLLLISATFFFVYCAYSQSLSNWTEIKTPKSNVIGQLVQNGVLSTDPVEESLIRTEDGADIFMEETKKTFNIKLLGSFFSKAKYSSVRISRMKIDYLADSAIFVNDKFLDNYFVYKALRADSVYIVFRKDPTLVIKPTDLLKDEWMGSIRKVIPKFDSLSIKSQNSDSLVIGISNPKVYFRAIVIRMKDEGCNSCRTSFGASFGRAFQKTFDMNLTNSTRRCRITLQQGTKPVFTLILRQDPENKSKLKLWLEVDKGFRNANGNITPELIEIPADEFTLDNKITRTFNITKSYLGRNISAIDRWLKTDGSRNMPIFLFIDAEQIGDRIVRFNNISDANAILSKLEWPYYSFTKYSGSIK
jgi:hypothetical protein